MKCVEINIKNIENRMMRCNKQLIEVSEERKRDGQRGYFKKKIAEKFKEFIIDINLHRMTRKSQGYIC